MKRRAARDPEDRKQRAVHGAHSDQLSVVQARYYEIGADISRHEQSIEHTRELRERQHADLAQTLTTLNELTAHIARDEEQLAGARAEVARLEPELAAAERAESAGAAALEAAETALQAWQQRWDASDVVIEGDDEVQQALRFAVYHLTSTANPEDERVSVGARGLTGDAYFGHVFWDTETYLLLFYTMTWPEAARAMLMYRYHTLPGARAKANAMGYKGALYAWELADTGEETTPERVVVPMARRSTS